MHPLPGTLIVKDRKYKTVTTSLCNQREYIQTKVQRKKTNLFTHAKWSKTKSHNDRQTKQHIYSVCYFQAWQPQLHFSIVIRTHYPWKLKGVEKLDTWWSRRGKPVSKKTPKKNKRYLECQQLCHALLCWKLDENRDALDYQSTTLGKGCRFWMSLISTEWEINASLRYLSATRAAAVLRFTQSFLKYLGLNTRDVEVIE